MDKLPLEILVRVLSHIPCSKEKTQLSLVNTNWRKAMQQPAAHDNQSYIQEPFYDSSLGYWDYDLTGSSYSCCDFLPDSVHQCYHIPVDSDLPVNSVEKLVIDEELEGDDYLVFTAATVAEISKPCRQLSKLCPNLELLVIMPPEYPYSFDEDDEFEVMNAVYLELPKLRRIIIHGHWLDCKLPAGCELNVWAKFMPRQEVNFNNIAEHLCFVALCDHYIDIDVLSACPNLKQIQFEWNPEMESLTVNGLAKLPRSVIFIFYILWEFGETWDNESTRTATFERIRAETCADLHKAMMHGWTVTGSDEGFIMQHYGKALEMQTLH